MSMIEVQVDESLNPQLISAADLGADAANFYADGVAAPFRRENCRSRCRFARHGAWLAVGANKKMVCARLSIATSARPQARRQRRLAFCEGEGSSRAPRASGYLRKQSGD